METLTTAGIKLCLSLGILSPTYSSCDITLMQSMPPSDAFFQSPITMQSIPNELGKSNHPDGVWDGCINYATYETMTDGKDPKTGHYILSDNGKTSGGKSWFCWKAAKLIWIPEAGRWRWVFDK